MDVIVLFNDFDIVVFIDLSQNDGGVNSEVRNQARPNLNIDWFF